MAWPRITEKWTSAVAGAAMFGLASATALTGSASDASAQEAAQPVAMEQIEVPMNDGRNVGRDGVQAAAAGVSNDAQTLVLYGPTNEVFAEAVEAARYVLFHNTSALNGIIVASSEPDDRGTEIAFYADGQRTSTILHADKGDVENLSDDIVATLEENYQNIVQPRRSMELSQNTAELGESAPSPEG